MVRKLVTSSSKNLLLSLAVLAQMNFVLVAQACPCAFDPTGPYTAAANAAMQKKDYASAQKMLERAMQLEKGNANVIYNLALVFLAVGNYQDAEKNMIKAINVLSSTYGPAHRQVAQGYMDLGDLYENESYDGKNPEFKKKTIACYNKSIALCEMIYAEATSDSKHHSSKAKIAESEHEAAIVCDVGEQQAALDLATALRRTADFYATDDLYKQAEPLYERSLKFEQSVLGPNDKDVCQHKADLADFYCEESKQQLAEPLFKEALEASEKINGSDSETTADILFRFANLYRDQKKYENAEGLLKRAVGIVSSIKEKDEMDVAEKTTALIDVLDKEGKADEAESVCNNLLAKLENCQDKHALILALNEYHKHCLLQHNRAEAERVASRIRDLKGSLSKSQ